MVSIYDVLPQITFDQGNYASNFASALFISTLGDRGATYEWNVHNKPYIDGVTMPDDLSTLEHVGDLVNEIQYQKAKSQIYRIKGGLLHVSRDDDSVNFHAISNDKKTVDAIGSLMYRFIKDAVVEAGHVHVLVRTPAGFDVAQAGTMNLAMPRENYNRDVLHDYDHAVTCLSSPDPCGRLVIMQGAPGTGKSYMIRSMITQVDAKFILIPSSIIGGLSGPEIVGTLLAQKEDGKPIVLVLEDADRALVTRELGNPSSMSELLNLADGLIGELADVRIIATTNAPRIDMDDAMMRPGRLCRCMEIGRLDQQHANRLYKEMIPGGAWQTREETTLAQVYTAARNDGWRPAKKRDAPSGQYL